MYNQSINVEKKIIKNIEINRVRENGVNIGKNIKKLREAKQITQEQLGKLLNVSHQAVSKWENGVTLPDVLILSKLGRVLEVLVDDLLKDEIDSYESYADRLYAIYAECRTLENFLRAEEEYRKIIESGRYTNKQLSEYGGIYHKGMHDCRKKAFEIYDKVIKDEKENKSELYYDMLRTRVSLQAQLGQCNQAIEECKKLFEEEAESEQGYILLLAAYIFNGKYEEGLKLAEKAIIQFPNSSLITFNVAECYAHFERYDEAFKYWDKTFELCNQYIDSMFSKAFCYQKLGRKQDELAQWKEIVAWLEAKGLQIAADNHRQNIIRLEEELAGGKVSAEK